MARQPDAPAGRQRLLGLAAVAALATATAVAFGRVFVGHAPTRELVITALASVVVAAAFERRSLALALLASMVGLALLLTWVVFPQTSWYLLPSLRTLRAVGRSLDFVAQQARVQVAPTPPFAPLMLAAVTATWTAAFSTHALAVRAGSPLLAALPCVALVGFADTVLEDGARPTYAILFLAAVLAVVFVDGLRRVREWGPVWSTRSDRGLGRVAARGAQIVAVVAVLAAVLVPGVLPGFHAAALVDFSTHADDGIDLDPFVSMQSQLNSEDPPVNLFEVKATTGEYWRLYALDTFDGTRWSSSDPEAKKGTTLQTPAQLPAVVPAGSKPLDQQVRVLHDIDDPWIPMAYPATSLTLPSGDQVRYDSDLGSVVLDGGLSQNLEYSVNSQVVAPTAEDLNLVTFGPAFGGGVYTQLPNNLDPKVKQVAEIWTQGAQTPYEKAMAIQDRFHSEFHYDPHVDPVADSDALLQFLVNTKRGFCQQFATAMAVLLRELDIPARVAVGFRQGHPQGDHFIVTSKDAHAWVEVYFGPEYGWLPFEPTPTRTNPLAQPGTYLNPTTAGNNPGQTGPRGEDGAVGQQTGPGSNCDRSTPAGRQLCNADTSLGGRRGGSGGGDLPPGFLPSPIPAPTDQVGYSIPYRKIGLVLGALVLLALMVVPISKWSWRRRTLRRAKDPRQLVIAAYRVFDGEATDVGLGRRDGETLEEHRARLAAAVAFSDGHLSRLTALATRAAYASEGPSDQEAREAVDDARTAASDVRRDAGLVKRLLGVYRPGV
jgi:transglutaminase-like putative cysteine protease